MYESLPVGMSKKALCVGCNYPSKAFGLAGAVNDAFLIADCLQKHYGFTSESVTLLHDVYPGQKKSVKVEPTKLPTRKNILSALDWLVRDAKNGDVVFFSFSGYGLQVDDMDGYHDEGFDEAILPTDFHDGREGDYSVIVADDIHDILMSVPSSCTVTVLMDCDHCISILDATGMVDGEHANGLKYQSFCGLKVHTGKMQEAKHNREVWQEEKARTVKARPRFQPQVDIDNPRKGRLPSRHAMSRVAPLAFAYVAAGTDQTAMELQVTTTVVDGKEVPKAHGVLTWSFMKALEDVGFACTHADLAQGIKVQMAALKAKDLPGMDQELQFTFSRPHSNPETMRILHPECLMHLSKKGLGSEHLPRRGVSPHIIYPPDPGAVIGDPGGPCTSAGLRVPISGQCRPHTGGNAIADGFGTPARTAGTVDPPSNNVSDGVASVGGVAKPCNSGKAFPPPPPPGGMGCNAGGYGGGSSGCCPPGHTNSPEVRHKLPPPPPPAQKAKAEVDAGGRRPPSGRHAPPYSCQDLSQFRSPENGSQPQASHSSQCFSSAPYWPDEGKGLPRPPPRIEGKVSPGRDWNQSQRVQTQPRVTSRSFTDEGSARPSSQDTNSSYQPQSLPHGGPPPQQSHPRQAAQSGIAGSNRQSSHEPPQGTHTAPDPATPARSAPLSKNQPLPAPIRGLTPPNLFGGAALGTGASRGGSFGHSFAHLHQASQFLPGHGHGFCSPPPSQGMLPLPRGPLYAGTGQSWK